MHSCTSLEEKLISRLKALSEQRKINALAERAGVDQSGISRAIGGGKKGKNQNLGLDKVSKILDALGAVVIFPDEEHLSSNAANQEKSAAPQMLELEARIAAQKADIARLADKDKIIELLEKHIAMLEKGEGNAFKAEILQYAGILAEIAGREGRTLADIVAIHWRDLSHLSSEEREALWQVTRSVLSKHPEFLRANPHKGMDGAPFPPISHNKKQFMLASLDTAQRTLYDLRNAADTLSDEAPFKPDNGTRTA